MTTPRAATLDRPTAAPAGAEAVRESALDDFLRRVNLLGQTVRSIAFSSGTVIVLTAVAIVALLSDAAFAWPSGVRILIVASALGLVLAAIGILVRSLWRTRFEALRVARMTEERLGRSDSLLTNAVEFRSGSTAGSPVLRGRVIRLADDAVRELSAFDVISTKRALRTFLAALAAVAAFGLGSLVAPKLYAMVVPRFLDPLGDHPPYTLLNFAVSISPEPVYHSRPAKISVEITGPDRVEEANLVFPGARPDEPIRSQPMFRAHDQEFVFEIARAESSARFYIETPRGRSQNFTLDVTAVPFFERVDALLEFPTYTGWKSHAQTLDQRGVRGIVGTRVTVSARSNLPLKSGTITLHPAKKEGGEARPPVVVTLSPDAGNPKVVSAPFPIEFNGRFELTLTAENGAASPEPLSGPITAIPDRGPSVQIAAPDRDLVAVEGWKVPVVIEASDDVQIARMRLFRGVNGWSPVPVGIEIEPAAPQVVRGGYEFDLDSLGAKAGDVITFYATVDDNAPPSPHSADSERHTIQVISEDEYKDFARQQYQMDELVEEFESFRKELDRLGQEREKALEQLEELRKKAEGGEALTPEEQKQARALEEQLQKFAQDLDQLRKDLDERAKQLELYEMEKEYTEQLETLSKQLANQSQNARDVAEQLSRMSQSSGLTPEQRRQLQDAAEKFQKENQPFDQESLDQQAETAEDLELMQLANSLMAQTDRLKAVIAQQRDLANRLAELAGKESLTPDEHARAQRFAKEQELLQQELQSLQKDLQEAAKQAEELLPNMAKSAREISDAISEAAIGDDQQSAAQSARDGDGNEAHRRAESAAKKLEALQAAAGQCQQCQGLQQGLDGPLSLSKERLGQMLQQLAQGRKVPGLGQKKGQGKGQGQSGQSQGSGEGQADGNSAGAEGNGLWKPGQSFPGSRADLQVVGPRTQESQESHSDKATMQSDGRGRFVAPDSGDIPGGPESLDPETREFSGSSAGNLRGVPVGYRDAAEAYFRRLAEERKSK